MVEAAGQSKNIVHLVESVRQSLGRGLVHPLLDGEGSLRVLTLEHVLESEIMNTFDPQRAALQLGDGSGAGAGRAPTEFLKRMVESVKRLTGGVSATATPVLLCPSPARYHLRRWLEPFLPKVIVLAPAEIPAEVRVRSIGTVS
jgi:flagellar biosynthesis protein FlhA